MTIYIKLLDEGTDVARPVECADLGNGLYRILATPGYDPEDERWEFPPGSIVRIEPRHGSVGDFRPSRPFVLRPYPLTEYHLR
jgi:hypothetical protein